MAIRSGVRSADSQTRSNAVCMAAPSASRRGFPRGGEAGEAGLAVGREPLGDPPRLDLAQQDSDSRPGRRAERHDIPAADGEDRAPPGGQRLRGGGEAGLVAAASAAGGPGDGEPVRETPPRPSNRARRPDAAGSGSAISAPAAATAFLSRAASARDRRSRRARRAVSASPASSAAARRRTAEAPRPSAASMPTVSSSRASAVAPGTMAATAPARSIRRSAAPGPGPRRILASSAQTRSPDRAGEPGRERGAGRHRVLVRRAPPVAPAWKRKKRNSRSTSSASRSRASPTKRTRPAARSARPPVGS